MGQSMHSTEVLVIGAGPGGYTAAIRAAQLGFDVTLVDAKGELGGMCLHHGCIPTKSLIHAVGLFYEAKNASGLGIEYDNLRLNYSQTVAWKDSVVNKLSGGITSLCKQHNITVIKAQAQFQNSNQVVLHGEDLETNGVEFRYCVIATGSKPRELPWAAFGGRVLTSWDVITLESVPEKLVVVGGGYIGVELGVMLAKAGCEVTIIEGTNRILSVVEEEVALVAQNNLEKLGVRLLLETKVEAVESREDSVLVRAGGEEFVADYALVAIGHVPVTESLQLELAGVTLTERGFVGVDEQCRTSQKNIFAVGDVAGGVMLAHKASAQGKVAAEAIADLPSAFDQVAIPIVVFSDPEIAAVGLHEQEAREQYGEGIKVGSFPYTALGKAVSLNQTDGLVKFISDENDVLLGIHGVGPGITDYIAEMALALEMGATAEDIALTIHPHPTLSESLNEAAESLLGQAIHLYPPKK